MTNSQIEISKKKAPRPIDILTRQVEALKNDVTPEKLKTVEPQLSRLEEKITIFKDSREQRVDELTIINKDFEQIQEKLEIKNFLERFTLSEKVARFLKSNPDKKMEDLNPAEFTENLELQKPEVWKNILEDAQKGLAVAATFEEKDFDWKNPKAYLEKAGEVGEEISNQIKKNPILTTACLIGGVYALYQLLKKDSSLWDKTKGAIATGIAGWLGLSLAGADLHKKAARSLAVSFAGEENVSFFEKLADDILGKDEAESPAQNKKPDQSPEKEEGGTLEYLGKIMPETALAIKLFNRNLHRPVNLPAAKRNFLKIFKSLNKEKGEAALEITKDGLINLGWWGVKGAGKAIVFTWTVTPKLINDFGDWLTDPEKPWYENKTGLLIKADAWVAGAGATIGVTKSIGELFYKKDTLGIIKTPKHLIKGGIKGGTIGQFKLAKNAIKTFARPLRDRNYKAIVKNPKIRIESSINASSHGAKSVFTWAKGAENRDAIRAIHKNISKLEETRNILAQANSSFSKKREKLLEQAHEKLDKIEMKEKILKHKGVNEFGKNYKEIESTIEKVEKEIAEQKQKIKDIRSGPTPVETPASKPTEASTKTPKPKAKSSSNVVDFEAKRSAKNGTPAELRTVQQEKPLPQSKPTQQQKPKLKLADSPKAEPKLSPVENLKTRSYLDWCKQNGVKAIPSKLFRKRLANFGTKALELGATPLMVFLTIHNIESALPSQRNEAIAENAAALAAFHIALKFGTATFEAIPGPLINKAVGAISIAMLSFFVGEQGVEEFSSRVLKKINLDFSEDSWADDTLLMSETLFGFGGLLGFAGNALHTGEDAQEFLERDMPALFHKGEIISRFRYNNVIDWNKRIQKRISETKSLSKKRFLENLLINENWQKMEAAKLAELEARIKSSQGEEHRKAEEKFEHQKKFLQSIGQYDEKKIQDKTFIQTGQEKLLEQKTLAYALKAKN